MKKILLFSLLLILFSINSIGQLIAFVGSGKDADRNTTPLSFGIGVQLKKAYVLFNNKITLKKSKDYMANSYLGGYVGYNLLNDESLFKVIPEAGFYRHKVNSEDIDLNSNVFMGGVMVTRVLVSGVKECQYWDIDYSINGFIEPVYFSNKLYQITAGIFITLK